MKIRNHIAGLMKAPDLFIKDAEQCFDRKTGEYICTQMPGTKEIEFYNIIEPEKEIIKNDPNQLNLF